MALYLIGIIAALIASFVFNKILHSQDASFLMLELPNTENHIGEMYFLPFMKKYALCLFDEFRKNNSCSIVNTVVLASFG